TEGHIHGDYGKTQQGDRCHRRRAQYEGAPCRLGPSADIIDIRRIRKIHCRPDRKVGQGDPGGEHQSGIKRRVAHIAEREAMKLPRRNFLHLTAGAAVLPAVPRAAWAQAYPTRPVHWIVSFAAGGPNDIVARIVGQYLSDHLGQQFVIENRAGAAGNVGMQSALNSAPDGYTIAFVGPNYAINPALYEK